MKRPISDFGAASMTLKTSPTSARAALPPVSSPNPAKGLAGVTTGPGTVSKAAVIASSSLLASRAQMASKYDTSGQHALVASKYNTSTQPISNVNFPMKMGPAVPGTPSNTPFQDKNNRNLDYGPASNGGMVTMPAPPSPSTPYATPDMSTLTPVSPSYPSSPSAPSPMTPAPPYDNSSSGGSSWSTPSDSVQSSSSDSWQSPSSVQDSTDLVSTGVGSPTTAMAVATPPLSLWQRILAWFGFGQKSTSTVHGNPTTVQEAVGQLVRRARNGDQNAMAMIAEVGKQAKGGNEKAANSARMLHEYIARNPVGSPGVQFGQDDSGSDPIYTEAVKLSHTGLLSNLRIGEMLSHLDSEDQDAFIRGMNGQSDRKPERQLANRVGRIVGQARKIQAVRMKISPIAKYNRTIAWELGES